MKTVDEEIQDMVVEALNTINDKLVGYGDNRDIIWYVTESAQEWAEKFYDKEYKNNW